MPEIDDLKTEGLASPKENRELEQLCFDLQRQELMRDFDKKDVVESCLILDTSAWKQAGILRPGVLQGGYWQWPGALTLGYVLDTQDLGKAMLGLLKPTSQAGVFLDTRIPLDTTPAPTGGVRLWWRCPECSRRSRH